MLGQIFAIRKYVIKMLGEILFFIIMPVKA